MLETLPFVLALAFAVVALYWLILRSAARRIAAQYHLLAEQLDLKLEQPGPKLAGLIRPEPSVYGHYRGRELSISVPGKGLQNTRQVETVLKIAVRAPGLSAQLTAAGPLAGMRQRDSGGLPRQKSGHADFDRAVDLRAKEGPYLATLLTEARRAWLATHLKSSPVTLYLGQEAFAYARLGLVSTETVRREFEAAAAFLCELAETVEENPGQNSQPA